MRSRQRDENRRQERMCAVIVNHLAAFDNAEGESVLRGCPTTRIGSPDGNGI